MCRVWLANFESNNEVESQEREGSDWEAKEQFAAHRCKDYPLKLKRKK